MIGTTLLNRYKIESELGKGGMGVVYKAHDTLLHRAVAIKFLNTAGVGTEGKSRLIQEARATAQLNHPNIVSVFDAGETEGNPFIVMEFVQGNTLRQTPTPSISDALVMAAQICKALDHAHSKGIIHRDLKLENIIVTDSQVLKLMDFGLARSSDDSRMTEEGVLKGTLAYIAPELIQGEPASAQSDLYAFGVILYELLTGITPFQGTINTILAQHLHGKVRPPSEHNKDIPEWADELVLRLLSKRPEERPASAKDVLLFLEQNSTAPITTDFSSISSKPENNLPAQLTSFIGREKEIAEIKEALNKNRLVTLVASGGAGKTRLALQAAAEVNDDFAQGVWFVELAPLADPALVPHSVAAAVGLYQMEASRPIQVVLTDYLREKNCLLLFDNCEHLIDACARLADMLLRACPQLKILATSREAFGMAGEVPYRVPSLAVPSLETPTVQTLTQYEAVRLFIDRATTIQPNFALTDQNALAVAQICFHLDGIPLAIELAAARVNVLSVEQISERLVDRFRLLTGGSRTALPRQQTLRALVDWSYSLLSQDERLLLERLSVFAGGWTLEAAENICGAEGLESFQVLDSLQTLAAKSLILVDEGIEGRARYRMLETIRQYAREKLVNAEQLVMFCDRHLDWFLKFAEATHPKLYTDQQTVILNHVDAEYDNFHAALTWSMESAVEKGLRLAAGLFRFWTLRGYWFYRLDWFKKLLTQPQALAPTLTRASTLVLYAASNTSQGEYTDGEKSLAESLQIYRQLGVEKDSADTLNELARLSAQQGDFPQAHELSRESLEISRKFGDEYQIGLSLIHLANALYGLGDWKKANEMLEENFDFLSKKVDMGSIKHYMSMPETQNVYYSLASSAQNLGDFGRARRFFEDGLVFFRKTGSSHEIAWFLRHLGNLSLRERVWVGAHALYQESHQIVRDLKDPHCIAHTLEGMAQVENGNGNYERAASIAYKALNLCEQIGNKQRIALVQRTLGIAILRSDPSGAGQMLKSSLAIRSKLRIKSGVAECLEALAKMNSFGGAFGRATKLFAATGMLRETISFPMTPAECAECDYELNTLRAELGEAAFNTAWADGKAMTWEQATEFALKEADNQLNWRTT